MNNNINFLVFGRFPTERAYGVHVIANANSFRKYGNINIFYPKTTNSKTINKDPKDYYSETDGINFKKINFYDITDNFIYPYLPSLIQQFLWLLFTYLFGKKVSKLIPNSEHEINWSTSSVLLYATSKQKQKLIYEMHGRARKIQFLFLKKIHNGNFSKALFISTSKFGFKDLKRKGIANNLYFMPNAVDLNLFKPQENKLNDSNTLNIGYVGQLHTYGVEKGVEFSIKALDKAIEETEELIYENILFSIIGGSTQEHEELELKLNVKNVNINFIENTTQKKVANLVNKLDIGLVPYPNDEHIAKYSSSLKLFEYIASGISVIASNVESNMVFEENNIGIDYYKVDDFIDLKEKLKFYISKNNHQHILKLSSLNMEYRKNLSWELRTEEIMTKI